MTRPFRQEPTPIEQLINAELKDEALQYKENPTLELYRMTLDRSRASEQQSEEVLYIGDQRLAVVTWGGRALVCDDVDSGEHAFEQILRDLEPAYGGRRSPIVHPQPIAPPRTDQSAATPATNAVPAGSIAHKAHAAGSQQITLVWERG